MLKELFQSIDAKDTDKFLTFCTEDVSFVFGNADPANGKEVVKEVLVGFFKSIDSISHEVYDDWHLDNDIIVRGSVKYTRIDKSTLNVPFCNIFKMKDDLIKDYLIYVDTSSLYN